MDAEPDKGEVAKILFVEEVTLRLWLYLKKTSAASGQFLKLEPFPNGG